MIDYGQTRRLATHDRLALAKVVSEVGKHHTNTHEFSSTTLRQHIITQHHQLLKRRGEEGTGAIYYGKKDTDGTLI